MHSRDEAVPTSSLLDQYHALREGAGVVDRSHRGRLRLTGADRRAYLQGLLTNDIAALAPGTGCYAAYLTPQGRMIADMRLFELGDELLVDLDGSVASSVRERWDRFVFSEDVQIVDRSSSTSQLGIYGPHAADVLARAFVASTHGAAPSSDILASMPLHANSRWELDGGPAVVLRSDDIGLMGFDVVVSADRKSELEAALRRAGALSVEADAAEVCRVEAGRPLFRVDMDEETIPLEAGIEDRAISLTKGCYVGQEIIIRVLHRGHGRVARRLVGLTFERAAPGPSRGDGVRAGERNVGIVTSAVHSPALGRPIALAYVHRDFTAPGTELTAGSLTAVVSALPFA